MNSIEHMNPEGLYTNPAFSQLVVTKGTGKTIYIGGQNAVDAQGATVGKGDIAAQTTQVMQNIETALTACGAGWDNVVKLTIIIMHGQDLRIGFQAAQPFLSKATQPAAVTAMMVTALAHPDALVEVDATAFLPDA